MAKNELIWIDVDIFAEALDAACDDTRKIVKQAIYSTMGKLRKRTKTRLSTELRKKWNIQKKNLDSKIKVKATQGGDTYESFQLVIKGAALSLGYFGVKQYSGNRVITTKGQRTNKRRSKFQGVQAEIIKGKKTRLTNAFIQTAASGHTMVLRRKENGRYPIDLKSVISVASMFADDALYDRFTDMTMTDLEQLFDHEMDWRLTKAGLI